MKLFRKRAGDLPSSGRPSSMPAKSPVFSYYSGRPDRPIVPRHNRAVSEPAPTGRRRQLSARQVPLMLALLAIIISVLYSFTLDTNPKIVMIRSGTMQLRESEAYRQAAAKQLAAHVSSRLKLTIDTQALRTSLRTQFPEIEDAAVRLPLVGRRPVLLITIARPTVLLTGNSGTYVLDQDGRAILSAAEAASADIAQLPMLRDESSLEVQTGKGVLPKQTITFIEAVMAQFSAKGLVAESLTLPALANELHVRIKGQPYYVKFNTDGDPALGAGSYFAVKERLEQEGDAAREYIDVRIEERIYYR